jgi:hypothetical protein
MDQYYFEYVVYEAGYEFIFSMSRKNEENRVYILQRPYEKDFPAPSHDAHMYQDEDGDYICFTGKIDYENEAISIAENWASGYVNIIQGNAF